MNLKKLASTAGLSMTLLILSACGGGGGGSSYHNNPPVSSDDIVRFPYETVFGDACRSSSEPTPGCTFVRATGKRVTVSADPTYNSQGYGSDDLWYVKFDSNGNASIFDDLGNFKRTAQPSEFAGYIAGTRSTIGVGTTGAFWENVASKTYWFGKNGVLYSANLAADGTPVSNYGQAINNKNAGKANNTNSKAMKSQENQSLIMAGAQRFQELGLSQEKSVAVASALNSMAVMSVERGAITESDYNRAFKAVYGGVEYRDALAAFNSFVNGDKSKARALVARSARGLDLSADEGEAYIKALNKSAMSKLGFDVDQISLEDEN